jgi:hypothetical protein
VPSSAFNSKDVTVKDIIGVPEALTRELAESLPYPIDCLGGLLSPMAKDLQLATETPMPICGSAVLSAAALSVQAHADIMIEGRVYPSSLYFLSIAESGERKTTVDRAALAGHRKYEKEGWEKYHGFKTKYDIEVGIYEASRNSILKDKKLSADQKRIQIEALVTPEKPRRPHLVIEDATVQALLKHLRDDNSTLGLYSSEGAMFLYGHSMQKEHQIHTVAALSQLWDGRAVQRNTVSDFENTAPLYGRRLSCHLMIQPRQAMRLLGDPELQSQGLLSRFLIAWPDSTIGSRYGENAVRLDKSASFALYVAGMEQVLKKALPLSKKSPGELEPRILRCSSGAYSKWRAFNNAVEKRMGPDGDLFLLRAFANKAGENCARVAAVLTLAQNIEAEEVPSDKMDNAIAIVKYHIQEILRVFCQGTVGADLGQAQTLLDWILEKKHKDIYPAMVYQHGPALFRTKDKAMEAIKVLEQHSYLFKREEGYKVDDKPRKEAWGVVNDAGG